MKVLGKNILVKEPVKEEKTSTGGIILQQKSNYSTPIESEVLSVGSEVKDINVGDTIMYMPHAGNTFKKDEEDYRVMAEEEVLLVV